MKKEVVTSQPLALLAKLAAVGWAIGGLLLIPRPQAADRVVIVLAPGIAEEQVVAEFGSGRAPRLASLFSAGLVAEVEVPGLISGSTFWRRALESAAGSQSRLRGGAEAGPIWRDLGSRSAVLGVPDVLSRGFDAARGSGAAAANSAFVAGSVPVEVSRDDLLAARLPAPFGALADEVRKSATALAPDRWSGWIETGAGNGEQFQVLRADADRYFLSPVYRTALLSTVPPSRVVVSDPFLDAVEASVGAVFVDHLVSVDTTRGVAAERLLGSGDDVRALFYGFTVGASAIRLFGGEELDQATRARVVEVLDQRLAQVSAAAGRRGLVVVIGGPEIDRRTSGRAWCLVSSGAAVRPERVRLDLPGLARLLRYLVGVPVDVKDRERLPAWLLARYPHRAVVTAQPVREESPARKIPWTPDSIESLLAVPGA